MRPLGQTELGKICKTWVFAVSGPHDQSVGNLSIGKTDAPNDWGQSNVSDWRVASRWEHQRTDGSKVADTGGTVVESTRPVRLVMTWEDPGAEPPTTPSKVTFLIEPSGEIVRLTVTHEDLPDQANRDIAAHGWSAVLSNLKSFLETGHVLPGTPGEMP